MITAIVFVKADVARIPEVAQAIAALEGVTEVYSVTEKRAAEDYAPLSEIMEATLDEIEAISNRDGGMSGVPTGFADLDDLSGELVADDRRILGDVIRHPLVVGGLMGGLVGRHAEAVADNLREDLIILHHGEFELFETKVFLTI